MPFLRKNNRPRPQPSLTTRQIGSNGGRGSRSNKMIGFGFLLVLVATISTIPTVIPYLTLFLNELKEARLMTFSSSNIQGEAIRLLDQNVGHIKRLCESSNCLFPTPNDQTNINAPTPLHVKAWMEKKNPSLFEGKSMIMYYSSHTTDSIGLMAKDKGTQRWERIFPQPPQNNNVDDGVVNISLSFEPMICRSIHSPSIWVDDEQERFYMYLHGHHCEGQPNSNKGNQQQQPTILYDSQDGVSWRLNERFLTHWNLFYFTTPVYLRGFFYVLSRVNNERGIILCRSVSIEGPFEEGPVVAHGLRHLDVHLVGEVMYVFFSMIGDRPERILLATIDTSMDLDWNDWKLLPGPKILMPKHSYEHGDEDLQRTHEGPARHRHEVRDPRFLPDERNNGESTKILSGLLFYVVQGERGISVARVNIDLEKYNNITANRDVFNIRPEVLRASSMAQGKDERRNVTNLLITGVGRTGTTAVCTLFQNLGIDLSHDNEIDCGSSYPGTDGAVSWYDAFYDEEGGRTYKNVIHYVREPLRTMNSRMLKCSMLGEKHLRFLMKKTGNYEDYYSRNDTCVSFALKHWVRRNSFVEQHASWRVQAEAFFADPLTVWEVCMAAKFGRRCPDLEAISSQMNAVPTNLNSMFKGGALSKQQKRLGGGHTAKKLAVQQLSWKTLVDEIATQDQKYAQIAEDMAIRYGYEQSSNHTFTGYACGFVRGDEGWDCWLEHRDGNNKHLTRSISHGNFPS